MVNSKLVVKHSFESKFNVTALALTTVLCSNDGASPSLTDGGADTGGGQRPVLAEPEQELTSLLPSSHLLHVTRAIV